MSVVQIDGYGDNLTVNGVRIGDLTPDEHESLICKFCPDPEPADVPGKPSKSHVLCNLLTSYW